MNKEIVREINANVNNIGGIVVNNELNTIIKAKVNKDLLEKQDVIANRIIELGYNGMYDDLVSNPKKVVKYLKKVNLNRPFEKGFLDVLFGTSIDASCSSSTELFYYLNSMVQVIDWFNILFEKIDEIEKEFSDMINNDSFEEVTTINKTIVVSQMKGLKQIKLSLLDVYQCYRIILKNPQIKSFYLAWLRYKDGEIRRIDFIYDFKNSGPSWTDLMVSKINKL